MEATSSNCFCPLPERSTSKTGYTKRNEFAPIRSKLFHFSVVFLRRDIVCRKINRKTQNLSALIAEIYQVYLFPLSQTICEQASSTVDPIIPWVGNTVHLSENKNKKKTQQKPHTHTHKKQQNKKKKKKKKKQTKKKNNNNNKKKTTTKKQKTHRYFYRSRK